MDVFEDNDEKIWFLVGMLLRNGRSCTPFQLSQQCHLQTFTSREIESLCNLPLSPLSLSDCGQVTFSHNAFCIFDYVKEKYETPALSFVLQDCPSPDFVSTYVQETLLPSAPVLLPQAPCLRESTAPVPDEPPTVTDVSYSNKPHALPSFMSGLDPEPLVSHFSVQSECSEGKCQPSPNSIVTKHYTRKRRREGNLSSSSKKQNISFETSYSCTAETKGVALPGSEPMAATVMNPATEIVGGIDLLTVTLPLDEDRLLDTQQQAKIAALVDSIAESAQCSLKQLCNVTNLSAIKTENMQDNMAEIATNGLNATTLLPAIEMEGGDRHESTFPAQVASNLDKSCENGNEGALLDDFAIAHIEDTANLSKQLHNEMGIEKEFRQADVPAMEMKSDRDHDEADVKCTDQPQLARPRGKGKTGLKEKEENGRRTIKLSKNIKTNIGSQAVPVGIAASLSVGTVPVAAADVPPSIKQAADVKVPSFEGFAVEAVEGSGGYGTVYKAVRKVDGKVFAIKCPFEKTSSTYVSNEIKVLQKYGGQHSIPRCISVIEEPGRQCLVLDYIEHEKPEVLKKEISISELQWYGFTLFTALAYLHGKGVIHRDVKPGNFLFSRQRKCGSLVDFNLALVRPKQGSSVKSRKYSAGHHWAGVSQYDCRNQAIRTSINEPKLVSGRYSSNGRSIKHREQINSQEKVLNSSGTPLCDLKQPSQGRQSVLPQVRHFVQVTTKPDLHTSHVAEPGRDFVAQDLTNFSSGRTSPGKPYSSFETANQRLKGLKHQSGTRQSPLRDQEKIPQTDDMQYGDPVKEPLPKLGRRELLDYAQKSRNSPQPQVLSLSSSQRKRVAAPQKKKQQRTASEQGPPLKSPSPNSKLSHLKVPITGPLPRGRGIGKLRKEGPCTGTKGYRAPEVLLKSVLQSEKIDIWSAGVSLFQLLLGKPPFSSSSNIEQSLMDIAQFCGAEAILVLAKEHNCQSSLSK